MGVTACDPDAIEIPACASDLRDGTWVRIRTLSTRLEAPADCGIGNTPYSSALVLPMHESAGARALLSHSSPVLPSRQISQ